MALPPAWYSVETGAQLVVRDLVCRSESRPRFNSVSQCFRRPGYGPSLTRRSLLYSEFRPTQSGHPRGRMHRAPMAAPLGRCAAAERDLGQLGPSGLRIARSPATRTLRTGGAGNWRIAKLIRNGCWGMGRMYTLVPLT